MFFQSWAGIGRTVVVGVLAYVALVAILRLSGKRTLSKLYAFDLVVTVALGSTLATILLSQDVALAEGITALALLVVLQFALTWLSVRWEGLRPLIRAEPRLLLRQGVMLPRAMRAERVTPEEVLAAVRREGVDDLSRVAAVVLEADGTFSVIEEAAGPSNTLAGVEGGSE